MLWVKGAEDPDFVWYRRIHPPHGGCVQPHAAADRHDPPVLSRRRGRRGAGGLFKAADHPAALPGPGARKGVADPHHAPPGLRRGPGGGAAESPPGDRGGPSSGEMPEPSPILSAVQALPAKYSAVIHLYYYEGYSIKEISKLLQIPLPTVGTRLSRGRERLRQLLKEDVE